MKNLFFDFDGTIANTQEGIINAIEYMVEQLNMEHLNIETYKKFIGPSLGDSLERFYPDFPKERYPEAIKTYQSYYNTKGVYQLELYKDMEDTLSKLKDAGYKLYVSSVKPEKLIKMLIPRLNLENYFSGLYGASDDEITLSTKKAILAHGLDDAKVSANETIMIGDRMTDMIGGRENNTHTLGVTYGFGDLQELQESGAEHIVDSVSAIVKGVKEFE